MIFLPLVALMFLAGALGEPPTALDTLVDAERHFSALSVEKGMREAFLHYLAEDGTIFRPLPVNGKKTWESAGPSGATLVWEPGFAEVSASGDLGYTTGPWELRPPAGKDSSGVAYGHFISVWKRPVGGEWRVAADIGITHPRPDPPMHTVGAGRGPTLHEPTPVPVNRMRPTDVGELDGLLSGATRKRGVKVGLTARAAADIRFNTEGAFPFLGVQAASAALDTVKGSMTFVPRATTVAGSGDLAYSLGVIRRFASEFPTPTEAPFDSSAYLHVWRRGAGGVWKLALAVWNPIRR